MPMSVQSCTKTLGTTETPFSEPLPFSLSAQRKAETIGIYRNDSMSSLFSEKSESSSRWVTPAWPPRSSLGEQESETVSFTWA